MIYKKILVPTDGSEVSYEASKHAIEIAKLMNSKIYTIYVIDIVPFMGLPTEGLWESMRELLEEEGKEAIKNIEEECKKNNIDVHSDILEGSPANEIVNYAKQKKIDLIVIGTTGKTGLDAILLGSVADKVSKKSHCPVLLVKKLKDDDKE